MRVVSGKVVDGRIAVGAKLPEGATVVVLIPEDDGAFEADRATEKMLLDAIAQSDRGEQRRWQSRSKSCGENDEF